MAPLYDSSKRSSRFVKSQQDIDETACLAEEIWREHYTPIIGNDQVEYMIDKYQSGRAIRKSIERGCIYKQIIYQGQAVGYYAIEENNPEGKLFLSKIYIRKDMRGLGLARFACEEIFEYARQQKLSSVWLTVNKKNIESVKIYEKIGFTQVDSVETPIGKGFVMDDYIMEYTL